MEYYSLGKFSEDGWTVANPEYLETIPHIRELLADADNIYHSDSACQNLAKQQSRYPELWDNDENLSPLAAILLVLERHL